MNNFTSVQILELIESVGEDEVQEILSNFSCEKNDEIEHFLKKNAVDFAKKKMSITHLVFNQEAELVGYFSLTHKPLTLKNDALSKRSQKRMQRHAKYDPLIESYNVSAFLIAQLGKNSNQSIRNPITGEELMDCTWNTLTDVQSKVGGGVVFLECEDRQKLLDFYQNEINHFSIFGERMSDDGDIVYKQLLRFF